MKQYIVQTTEVALSDLEETYNYIAEQLLAPEAATRLYDRIANAVESLKYLPSRIKLMDLNEGFVNEPGEMHVDNLSAFFVIIGDHVIVTNILYSASDIISRQQ